MNPAGCVLPTGGPLGRAPFCIASSAPLFQFLNNPLRQHVERLPSLSVVLRLVHAVLRGPRERATGGFAWASTNVCEAGNPS